MNTGSREGRMTSFPDQTPLWRRLEQSFQQCASWTGYGEIRTPVFEHAALFLRAVGEHTDVGGKGDVHIHHGRGQRRRAAGAAPRGDGAGHAGDPGALADREIAARQGLLHCAHVPLRATPGGPVPAATQSGVEAVGETDPALDAEVIDLLAFCGGSASRGISSKSIPSATGQPAAFRAAVRAAFSQSGATVRRLPGRLPANPLRILDCKMPDWAEPRERICRPPSTRCPRMRPSLRHLVRILSDSELKPRAIRGWCGGWTTTPGPCSRWCTRGWGAQSAPPAAAATTG